MWNVCRLIAHDNSGENRKEATIYGTISWHKCQRMLHSSHIYSIATNFMCLPRFSFWFDKIACAPNSSWYHFNHLYYLLLVLIWGKEIFKPRFTFYRGQRRAEIRWTTRIHERRHRQSNKIVILILWIQRIRYHALGYYNEYKKDALNWELVTKNDKLWYIIEI